ncbi:MAG: heme ABC exporter ATP-binding protein CcmA [Dehalococcoidia bacterium]
MTAIQTRGLCRAYGPHLALDGIDLSLDWGQTLVVFGPNGSGKTTLVRVLSGLARPTGGWGAVAGFPLHTHALEVRRTVGLLTHAPLLYADLTIWENLLFFARMFGVSHASERIGILVHRLGLEDRLHHRLRTLSHGLQKRAALARALLHQPRVLLLDEPEAGLDAAALSTLEQVVREHCAGGGATLITTHQVSWGLALAHSAVALLKGRLALTEKHPQANAPAFLTAYQRLVVGQGNEV